MLLRDRSLAQDHALANEQLLADDEPLLEERDGDRSILERLDLAGVAVTRRRTLEVAVFHGAGLDPLDLVCLDSFSCADAPRFILLRGELELVLVADDARLLVADSPAPRVLSLAAAHRLIARASIPPGRVSAIVASARRWKRSPQAPPSAPPTSIAAIARTPLAIAPVVSASRENHCGRSTLRRTSYSLPSHAPSPPRIAASTSVHTPV